MIPNFNNHNWQRKYSYIMAEKVTITRLMSNHTTTEVAKSAYIPTVTLRVVGGRAMPRV